MTFNFIKLPELDFDLKAETTESGRKYVTPNGARYPSVTTVLSSYNKKAIMEWRQRVGAEEANKIAGRASRRGTQLHSLCEKYILGELTEMKRQTLMPLDKMMFGEITNLPINKIVVAIATEEEVPQIFVKDKKEYLPELNQFIDKYWRDIAV